MKKELKIQKDRKLITRRKDGSIRVQTVLSDVSLAKQEFKDQCDINHIMRQFNSGKQITHIRQMQGQYMNLTELPNLFEAKQIIATAHDTFMTLPSQIRARFDNDPQALITFLNDPNNNPEAIKLGLKYETPTPEQGGPKAKPSAAKPEAPSES